ncbi:MAG: thioredoxin family protein [Tunicatimonas sp.]
MLLWFALMMGGHRAFSQQTGSVRWLSFAQLDDSLKVHPKKVFVDFTADWCAYCRKMDKVAFRDQRVAALLNTDYYAVRMNVETPDTITFGNQVFVNERINKPNPVHQIALLMARRKGKPFSLPAMVVLNEKFEATARYFQYLNAEQMREVLEN